VTHLFFLTTREISRFRPNKFFLKLAAVVQYVFVLKFIKIGSVNNFVRSKIKTIQKFLEPHPENNQETNLEIEKFDVKKKSGDFLNNIKMLFRSPGVRKTWFWRP